MTWSKRLLRKQASSKCRLVVRIVKAKEILSGELGKEKQQSQLQKCGLHRGLVQKELARFEALQEKLQLIAAKDEKVAARLSHRAEECTAALLQAREVIAELLVVEETAREMKHVNRTKKLEKLDARRASEEEKVVRVAEFSQVEKELQEGEREWPREVEEGEEQPQSEPLQVRPEQAVVSAIAAERVPTGMSTSFHVYQLSCK